MLHSVVFRVVLDFSERRQFRHRKTAQKGTTQAEEKKCKFDKTLRIEITGFGIRSRTRILGPPSSERRPFQHKKSKTNAEDKTKMAPQVPQNAAFCIVSRSSGDIVDYPFWSALCRIVVSNCRFDLCEKLSIGVSYFF